MENSFVTLKLTKKNGVGRPSKEFKRTLLSELPTVWPKPGSSGLNSKRPSKSVAF